MDEREISELASRLSNQDPAARLQARETLVRLGHGTRAMNLRRLTNRRTGNKTEIGDLGAAGSETRAERFC